jgi:hypothetical protein
MASLNEFGFFIQNLDSPTLINIKALKPGINLPALILSLFLIYAKSCFKTDPGI